MLDNIKKKQGFTLVEILIVIMIVGLLSTMAISGYSSYRKSALVELNGDNLISQIYQMRENVIRGNINSERSDLVLKALREGETIVENTETEAKCFGMIFQKTSGRGFFDVKNFAVNFENKQVFNKNDGWNYEGCEKIGADSNLENIEKDKDFFVESIKFLDDEGNDLGSVSQSLLIRFVPPNGYLEVIRDFDRGPINFKDPNTPKKVEFLIKYGIAAEDEFKRKVILDFASLTYQIKNL